MNRLPLGVWAQLDVAINATTGAIDRFRVTWREDPRRSAMRAEYHRKTKRRSHRR